MAMTILAKAAGVVGTLHHVDHHLRPSSAEDARVVEELARRLGFEFVLHDVVVPPGGNLEARARSARRAAMPADALTAHSMDDQAETIVINFLRGAGLPGLSSMVRNPTKPVVALRRAELLEVVVAAGEPFVVDETNRDRRLLRNRVRAEVVPMLNDAAQRDIVPILARQAEIIFQESELIEGLVDDSVGLEEADCRDLAHWPTAILRHWLRRRLVRVDPDGTHSPSSAEIDRVIEVVEGLAAATELSGGRRVSRHRQHLRLHESAR